MIYIASTSLDYITGYSIHVMKSVDNILKFKNKTSLYVPNFNSNNKLINKRFNTLNQKKLQIYKSFFKNSNFFLHRLFFGFQAALFVKSKKKQLILTRCMWSSFFMILFKVDHILEIHNIASGLINFLFYKLGIINSKNIKKIIVINKELLKYINCRKKNFLILPDAVDLDNFKYQKKKKFNIKNILYYGSFYEGRGIDLIYNLAKYFKDINFILIGIDKKISSYPTLKNIKLKKKIEYSKIPKILEKYEFVIMPYETKVFVNAKNVNTAEYMSPLKMFEALAMGNIILSSNLNVLKKILKNDFNALIVKDNTFDSWKMLISNLEKKKNFNSLSKNANKTARMFTWEKRVKRIIKIK